MANWDYRDPDEWAKRNPNVPFDPKPGEKVPPFNPNPPKTKPKQNGKKNGNGGNKAGKISSALSQAAELAANLADKGLTGYSPSATPVRSGASTGAQTIDPWRSFTTKSVRDGGKGDDND